MAKLLSVKVIQLYTDLQQSSLRVFFFKLRKKNAAVLAPQCCPLATAAAGWWQGPARRSQGSSMRLLKLLCRLNLQGNPAFPKTLASHYHEKNVAQCHMSHVISNTVVATPSRAGSCGGTNAAALQPAGPSCTARFHTKKYPNNFK